MLRNVQTVCKNKIAQQMRHSTVIFFNNLNVYIRHTYKSEIVFGTQNTIQNFFFIPINSMAFGNFMWTVIFRLNNLFFLYGMGCGITKVITEEDYTGPTWFNINHVYLDICFFNTNNIGSTTKMNLKKKNILSFLSSSLFCL